VLVPSRIVRLHGIIDIGDLPFDLAAMIEPVSCCLSAAEQCGTKPGDNVLVVGCGPLGLLHIIVSKALGAKVIASDLSEVRLSAAKELGADYLLNPRKATMKEEIWKVTGVGADVVIAAVGSAKGIEEALPLVRNGGVFNIFGGTPKGDMVSIDPRWLHYGEVVLTGTFAASLRHFKHAFQFVKMNGEAVSRVISERCHLDDVLKAVERAKNGTALKTILMFD
jgi:threonine dehydrogenase-like Zn-dependent dehydrogenase